MSEHYEGSCHCGAVKFSYDGDKIESGLRCNCSICARKGAMMTTQAIAESDLKVDAQEDSLGLYQFGSKTAKHYFCKTCGIYTFNETLRAPGHFRVNLGCIDNLDTSDFEVAVFDGKNLL